MKLSYNQLKQYTHFTHSPEDLGKLLTSTGLEVEGIERAGGEAYTFSQVVVGHVETVIPHPDADRLRICTVEVGQPEKLTIVCGAPNVAVGQKVPVALVGAILYPIGSTEPLKIKKGKIRGQASEGMICAEDELGIGTNHEGIMILPESAIIGTPLTEVLSKDDDFQLEVAITPNRIDAASHIGAARDIAAVLKTELKMPEIFDKSQLSAPNPISITIEATDLCKRYTGIYIQGVKVQESPDWLKKQLNTIGLRPINNIVDITNYVMMELGQPLHAFDADTLNGNAIVVRTLASNQPFVTLDEKERALLADTDVMICDATAPKCIAGIFGGLHAGVTMQTQNVFLESAYFDATAIRRTAKRLGLSTDSSFRFERGANPLITEFAALRALKLIVEMAGGTPSVVTDVQLADFPPFAVDLSIAKTQSLIGKAIPREEIIDILQRLDIVVKDSSGDILHLQVPPYRVDVTRPQDVVEEILRIYGFNNVEFPGKMNFTPNTPKRKTAFEMQQIVANMLSNSGFYEIWNNSLTANRFASEKAVNILNPLSEELGVMRETLLNGGLETIRYNQNRQNDNLSLYEFGKTYLKSANGYFEREWLALFITGSKHEMHWETKQPKTSFFTLSREAQRLANLLGIKGECRETTHPEMDYAVEFVSKKKSVFVWGKVAQAALDAFDIHNEVFYMIGDWEAMYALHAENKTVYQAIPPYPGIRRDISMLIPDNETFANIQKTVAQVNPLIKSVELHDVYKGKNIAEGQKSYLISLLIQDETRTLEDTTADKIWEKVCKTLENRIGAAIRIG